MGKNLKFVVIGILLVSIVSTMGCTDKESIKTEEEKKVFLDSDIIELAYSSLDLTESHGQIIKAEVSFRCTSLLDKTVKILYYDVEFCDKDGNILYTTPPKLRSISNLPPRYTETTPNTCEYIGDNTKNVDHAYIRVTSYEIAE